MEREELSAWLRLTLTPGVGNLTARKLLAAFGLPTAVFAQTPSALAQVASQAQVASLRAEPPELAPLLETTWRWLHGQDADAATGHRRILALGDAGYPESLLNIEDPPLMLYLLGAGCIDVSESNTALASADITRAATDVIVNSLFRNAAQSVAIVGSRNPTPQGLGNARQFARALSQAGLTVVSGMALGVDGAAHEGALEGFEASAALNKPGSGRLATIAVVGTGLDRVYPKSHRALAHAIAKDGLIISEYPLGTPPLAANFPKRNRIIAGLAQGTLVVEAALKSGSLITAQQAAEQGKEVFVIPGSIHSTQSRGCHALIRQGAKLVESAQDILEDMKIDVASIFIAENVSGTLDMGTNDSQASLLAAIGFDPVSLDALQARTGIDTPHLQAQLMALELEGQVARLPGGLFQRLVQA
jgi:DNA processing protein